MRVFASLGILIVALALGVVGICLSGCGGAAQKAAATANAVEAASHREACEQKAAIVIDMSQQLGEVCEVTAWRLEQFAHLDVDCRAFFGPDGPDTVKFCKDAPDNAGN